MHAKGSNRKTVESFEALRYGPYAVRYSRLVLIILDTDFAAGPEADSCEASFVPFRRGPYFPTRDKLLKKILH